MSVRSPVEFKGYAAIFHVRDVIGDVIEPGAFARSLAGGRRFPLHWQHRAERRIGWVTAEERSAGLAVEGEIEEPQAAAMVADGAARGLSFAYRARGYRRLPDGRRLDDIELIEVSVVTHPLQPLAVIAEVVFDG